MDSDDELLGRMMDAMEEADDGSAGSQEEDWTDTGWAQPPDHVSSLLHAGTETRQTSVAALSGIQDDKGKKKEPSDPSVVKRMLLNDNKAGMQGLDKDRINQIIHEASKGSKFYENERQKEEQMKKRIEEQKRKIGTITDAQLKEGLTEADRLLEDFDQQRDLSRTIVHTDMDAFYAAVEMRDRPELKHKPMAVGGTNMLSTSNYEARKFGVRAAMPGFIAKKLCPDLTIVPTNFDKYTAVSKQVRAIFTEYDPNFCPMSLDEAYLDITQHLAERTAMSEQERTYMCRNRAFTHSTHHCLCDLNDIVRNVGTNSVISDSTANSVASDSTSKDALSLGSDTLCSDAETTRTSVDFHSYLMGGSMFNNIKEADAAAVAVAADHDSSLGAQGRPLCPVCHKELPPFHCVRFGLTDEDAVDELRTRIEQKTRLTASAGIAPNMMLAKVCSDRNKPNGQYKVPPTKTAVIDFIKDLPTRKISGIGKVSEAMLNALGVYTCTQLYERRALLYHLYSPISFNYFMRICLGIGSTTVERDSERKSISTERTFSELSRPADLYRKCEELCDSLAEDLKTEQLKGKTVGIKIKTVKFEVKTKAHTLREYTNERGAILRAAIELLRTEIQACSPQPLRLRLMGVRMSNLLPESHCGGKKQRTILGAFKKLSEKAGHTQTQTKPCIDTVTGASDFVSGSVVQACPLALPSDTETVLHDPEESENVLVAHEIDCESEGSDGNLVKLDETDDGSDSNLLPLAETDGGCEGILVKLAEIDDGSDSNLLTLAETDGGSDGELVKLTETIGDKQDEPTNDKDGKSDVSMLTNGKSDVSMLSDGTSDVPMLSDNPRLSDSIGTSLSHVHEKVDTLNDSVSAVGHTKDKEDDEALESDAPGFSNTGNENEEIVRESVNAVTNNHGQNEEVRDKRSDSDVEIDFPKTIERVSANAQEILKSTNSGDLNICDNSNDNLKTLDMVDQNEQGTLKDTNTGDLNNCDISNDTKKNLEMVASNTQKKVQDTLKVNDQGHSSVEQLEEEHQQSNDSNDSRNPEDVEEQLEVQKQSSTERDARIVPVVDIKPTQGETTKPVDGRRRTRSGVVCTPHRQSTKKRRSSKKEQSVSYTCPVCTKDILCANLNEFNSHVDECLNKNAAVESKPTKICDKDEQGESKDGLRLSEASNEKQSEGIPDNNKTNEDLNGNKTVEDEGTEQSGSSEHSDQSVDCKDPETKMVDLATSNQDVLETESDKSRSCVKQNPDNKRLDIVTFTNSKPDEDTSPEPKSVHSDVCDNFVARVSTSKECDNYLARASTSKECINHEPRASTSKENVCDIYIATASTSNDTIEFESVDKSSIKPFTNPKETMADTTDSKHIVNKNVSCGQSSSHAKENALRVQGSSNITKTFNDSVMEKPGTSCSDDYNNNKETVNQAAVNCEYNERDHCTHNLQLLDSKEEATKSADIHYQAAVAMNSGYNDCEVAEGNANKEADSDDDTGDGAGLLVCPICNTGQRCGNLADFNNHVDACLSRGAIKEILQEQRKKETKPQKRPSLSPAMPGSQPSKRRKTVLPPQKPAPCRTIASFFKDK